MKLTVAIAQIDIALAQPDINQLTVAQYAQKAGEAGVDVLIYPEMWRTGYALEQLVNLADEEGVKTQDLLSQLARQYHINIIGGSVATRQQDAFYNTMFVYDKNGHQVSTYNKLHLFGLLQ